MSTTRTREPQKTVSETELRRARRQLIEAIERMERVVALTPRVQAYTIKAVELAREAEKQAMLAEVIQSENTKQVRLVRTNMDPATGKGIYEVKVDGELIGVTVQYGWERGKGNGWYTYGLNGRGTVYGNLKQMTRSIFEAVNPSA